MPSGGFDNHGNNLNTVEAYNARTNSWATVASIPTARYALAASLGLDGRIYAIGGRSDFSGNAVNTVGAYTP